MVSCITGAARREIIPIFKQEQDFRNVKQEGFFLKEMMKRLSQQKYDENQEQEYLDKKQRKEEDTRRGKW